MIAAPRRASSRRLGSLPRARSTAARAPPSAEVNDADRSTRYLLVSPRCCAKISALSGLRGEPDEYTCLAQRLIRSVDPALHQLTTLRQRDGGWNDLTTAAPPAAQVAKLNGPPVAIGKDAHERHCDRSQEWMSIQIDLSARFSSPRKDKASGAAPERRVKKRGRWGAIVADVASPAGRRRAR